MFLPDLNILSGCFFQSTREAVMCISVYWRLSIWAVPVGCDCGRNDFGLWGGGYSPSETGWGAGRHWKQNHCSSALKGARWGGCGQEALGRLHSEVAGGGDQRGTRWGSTSLGWNCLRIRQESKMAALQTDLGLATGNGWRLGLWYETMLGFSFFYNSYRVRKALHSTP